MNNNEYCNTNNNELLLNSIYLFIYYYDYVE